MKNAGLWYTRLMNVVLETWRLLLRPVYAEDYLAVYAWAGDPVVNKYMIYPLHQSAEATKAWLSSRNIDDPDSCDLGIVLKETGELIGMGGLNKKESGLWNLGYNLRADMWGKGYVPEAMKAIIEYTRGVTEIKAIEAEYALENPKSRRVMEKLGMNYHRKTTYTKLDGSATFDAEIYRIEF